MKRKLLPGTLVSVVECSGITSGYSGRVATQTERYAYMKILETTDPYNLHLIRDEGWIVCVFYTCRGRPLHQPITDCMCDSRLIRN